MFCSKCGAQIADDSMFCFKCGASTAQAQPQPVQEQPVQPTVNAEGTLPIFDANDAVPEGNCKHLPTEETKKYLQYVKKLEVYLYTLNQTMSKNDCKIASLGKPVEYTQPTMVGYMALVGPIMAMGGGIVALLALFVILFAPGRSMGDLLFDLIFNLEIVIAPFKAIIWGLGGAVITAIVAIIVFYFKHRKDVDEYYADLASDRRKVEKENEQIKELEKQNKRLDSEFTKTFCLLEELYDMNVLFPKYRDLVSVTTLCEYFEAERCFDLTGPSGAYNIYEYETRQNIIISKLDEVISRLDQIRSNQYALYQAIQESNMISEQISEQNTELISQNRTIAQNTAASAYYSKLAADYSMISAYYSIS